MGKGLAWENVTKAKTKGITYMTTSPLKNN